MMRAAATRLSSAPFETALAILLIISGMATFARWGPSDPVDALLPVWETDLLAAVFALTGIALITGIAAGNVAAEASGLLLLCASLTSRLILYGFYLGVDTTFFLTGSLDAAFIMAAQLRLITIRRRRVVIELRRDDA